MRTHSLFSMVILAAWWAVAPAQAWAGLVFGPSARTQFEGFRDGPTADTFVDFDSFPAGTALTTQVSGITFQSNIDTVGNPFGPINVYVSSAAQCTLLCIVGTPSPGSADDGRVGYQIVFTNPQRRAGLMRKWTPIYTVTRFYNASGVLLAEHQNTVGNEFVGYIAGGSNPGTDWVARIQMDGLVNDGITRQVGYSDDLFFGSAEPPDSQAPSIPGGLAATAVSASQINLAWNAATDNTGVTAYRVFRGGVFHATVNGSTSFSDIGLIALTSYSYTVAACDGSGNCSAQSASASASTPASGSTYTANLVAGFNLIGNSLNITINVAATFGNLDAPTALTSGIVSIWKWNAVARRWAFHTPQLSAADSAAYAAAHNYDVLAAINPGEGYWVNAIGVITLPAQTGMGFNWFGADPTILAPANFTRLPSGFNLIAHADTVTPGEFNINVSPTPPDQGVIPVNNFLTLWAWDAVARTWYFHSPVLEASPGGITAVKDYAVSHFYRHFQDYNKLIGIGVGFWVNKP